MNKRQRKKVQFKMKLLKEPHFTDEQLWNMDVTLAKYISSGLKAFLNYVETKEELPGHPNDFKNMCSQSFYQCINMGNLDHAFFRTNEYLIVFAQAS